MLKNSVTTIPYNEIDYEIRELIRYINKVDGIETDGCCCGHGKSHAWIGLKVESIEILNKFMYRYFYRNHGWEVSLYFTDVDIDTNNWDELKFILHTTELIDPKYVALSIADVTKEFKLKQQEILVEKVMAKLKDKGLFDELSGECC